MTFRRAIIRSLTASVASLFFYCANLAGGGGSEWEAKIAGRAVYAGNGLPIAGARVVLCPERFLKDTSGAPNGSHDLALRETVTDKAGFFSIGHLKPGIFHIEVNDNQSWASLSTCEVFENESARAITCTLKPTGRISGTLALPEGYQGSAYVQVYGLDRVARAAPDGAFALSDIPEGSFTLRVLPSVAEYMPKDVVPVAVTTGAETDLGSLTVPINGGLWSHKRLLYLNTTATGANVAGEVTGFPVLIRLNSENFDFSQAQAIGADIRFTKPDNTFLPYEIERWDAAAGLAEVWVKVDTVRGIDSMQSVTMYWGASTVGSTGSPQGSATPSLSNGAAVFDSSAGFEGVWHLNETSGALAADASYNGFTGTYRGGLPRGVIGPFGICQYLGRQDSDYVDMGDALNPGVKNISFGVWVKRAAFGAPQALIAKTNGGAPSAAYGYLFSFDQANFVHVYLASGGTRWGDDGAFDISSTLAIADSAAWHHVFAVIDRSGNGNCRIYIDGIDRTGGAYGNVANVHDIVNTLRLRIGTENDNSGGNKGAIGEATIAFTVRSADWVKLSYMNQKGKDALVKW